MVKKQVKPQDTQPEPRPLCCGKPMARSGTVLSGRNHRRRWKCSYCGRTTIIAPEVK